MKDGEKILFFQKEILKWFISNGRTFLWREPNTSNYIRIISEVLLQRTKAETVSKFFPGFLDRFPSWESLWLAQEQEIQEILRPIGLYKQRGSRLYKLVQELSRRNGIFPIDSGELREMPMMGQYIANAYELLILNKASPLLDVNMARVLERFSGPRKMADIRYDPYLQELAYKVVNHEKSKEINWAILDFAALICKARLPKCIICPLNIKCKFFNLLT